MGSVQKLYLLGQSIWYDNLQRSLIEDGTLKGMIERREILGATSNPSIFKNAIANSKDYDRDLQVMSWAGLTPKEMFYHLAIQDIQNLADLFLPYYLATNGGDGFVSLEVDPNLAYDTQGTIDEALWLWETVDRPNLMVKIPATKEGLPAIATCVAAGVNINVTLIFSCKRYVEVMVAFSDGLERRLGEGKNISSVASVASFFVSRLETKADERLQHLVDQGGEKAKEAQTLLGKIAVDNTRLAYLAYENFFSSPQFTFLRDLGAQRQRPLWASTSTKDPAYSDIKYVEELVAENTVNTVPPETLTAYLDHGDPRITIDHDLDQAQDDMGRLAALGISIDEITQELEDEGVRKFADSFIDLLQTIESRKQKFILGLGVLVEPVKNGVSTLKSEDVIARIFRNDPTVWTELPDGKDTIQKRLGWLSLPSDSVDLVLPLRQFAEMCLKEGFEKLLLLGMGGSSLAPETMSLIFGDALTGLSLKILDSTIPEQVRAAEDWVDYDTTLFIVASKSGGTTETLSNFHYFWAKAEAKLGERCGAHFIAITDPGSKLVDIGTEAGFRAVFTADPNVGGRYSALTHFGLVPAALMGIDLDKFLTRAQMIAEECRNATDVERNPGALLGLLFGLGSLKGKDKLTLLTDEGYTPLGPWLEQLIAESSGKIGRGIVPIADEPQMPADFYPADRLFVYIRQAGARDSLVEGLRSNNHTVVVLDVPDVYSLASQFFLWEFAVAVACSVLGVNAFDQPDVQDSKDRTNQKLTSYLAQKELNEPKVTWSKNGVKVYGVEFEGLAGCESVAEVISAFGMLSRAGDYIAINAYLRRNTGTAEKLTKLRKRILEQTRRATTLGFGPRFLHSTGQLHKGGDNNGLFIQITQEDEDDLAIPGKDYSFGILARAQALGDLEALLARERRAIRIHLPAGDPLAF